MSKGYEYIFLTIFFTVYGQLMIKWQMAGAGVLPGPIVPKLIFLFRMFTNFWVMSAFVAAFLAALCWMAVMTKLDLSHAYPFIGLTFVLVLFSSGMFFHEPITMLKIAGVVLILAGIIIGSQG
jgi:multidrug transporter EmrE-like cation transporter